MSHFHWIIFYSSLIFVSEQPGFDPGSVNVIEDGDVLHVSWDPPTGDFTSVILYQCHNRDDEYGACIGHDVTDVSSLTVSRSDGDWLKLVWWQDRDDVLTYYVIVNPDKSTEDGSNKSA